MFVMIAAFVAIPGSRHRAPAAPPVDDEQHQRDAPAAEPTPEVSLPSSVEVKALDDSAGFSTMPAVHPQLVGCCRDVELAILRLREIDGYTARWFRQVRIGGALRDSEEVLIKVRHQPFSVCMEWADGSRHVCYVEGQNDDKLMVRNRRGFGTLGRIWRIPPDSALAMKDSRYPITQLGLLKLAERLQQNLTSQPPDRPLQARVSTVEESGRVCRRHVLEFAAEDEQVPYARTEFDVDEQTSVVVQIINYAWTGDGVGTQLLEHYRYDDIQLNPGLTDDDFDLPE